MKPVHSRQLNELVHLQIWALDVGGPNDDVLVTGGGDATVTVWADCTAADSAQQQAVEDDRLSKQQDLSNALVVRLLRHSESMTTLNAYES